MSDTFPEDLPPLKVRCTDSNCEEDLHCYRATAEMVRDKTAGRCRSCGISLVDWDRVHQRDVTDAGFTFETMKTEFIRHHFWHIEIDTKAIEHARKKGLAAILDHVPKRLIRAARERDLLPQVRRGLAQHSQGSGVDRGGARVPDQSRCPVPQGAFS